MWDLNLAREIEERKRDEKDEEGLYELVQGETVGWETHPVEMKRCKVCLRPQFEGHANASYSKEECLYKLSHPFYPPLRSS